MSNAWQGERYDECGRVLILLESTYCAGATPHGDVTYWIETGDDATYRRLHSVLGVGESRQEFAARFALDNVAIEPVGDSNASKVTSAHLRAGAATLPERLRQLAPNVVWLATAAGRPYAKPVIEQLGVRVVCTNHPLFAVNLPNAEMQKVGDQLFTLYATSR